jgi:hypothetical protein
MMNIPAGVGKDALLGIDQVDIKDRSNPNSLINKLPTQVAAALSAVPDSVFLLGDDELVYQGRVTAIDRSLKHSLWYEYNLSIVCDRLMVNNNIFTGVCRRQEWDKIYLNSMKLAFICTPPINYRIATQEMLELAQAQIREILLLPSYTVDRNGKTVVDNRIIGHKIKVWEFLNQRVHGAFTQKMEIKSQVETKSLNMNVDTKNIGEIEARIKELESQVSNAPVLIGVDNGKEREAIKASDESETMP